MRMPELPPLVRKASSPEIATWPLPNTQRRWKTCSRGAPFEELFRLENGLALPCSESIHYPRCLSVLRAILTLSAGWQLTNSKCSAVRRGASVTAAGLLRLGVHHFHLSEASVRR